MEPVALPDDIDTLVALVGGAYAMLEEMAAANAADGFTVHGMHGILAEHEFRGNILTEFETRIVIYFLKALGLIRNVGVKPTDGEWWVRPRRGVRATSRVGAPEIELLIAAGKVPKVPVDSPIQLAASS